MGVYVGDYISQPSLKCFPKQKGIFMVRKSIRELFEQGIAIFKRIWSADERRLLSCIAEISMLKQLQTKGVVTDREYIKIDRYIRKAYGISDIPETGTETLSHSS